MNHQRVAERIEIVSMATGISAGVTAAGAVIAEPTGLNALGVWVGLVDEPLVVTAAPVLGMVATVAGTLSGIAFFVAICKKRQIKAAEQHKANHTQ